MTVTHLALTTEALIFPHNINSTITESYLLYPVAYNGLESLYLKTEKSTACSDYICLPQQCISAHRCVGIAWLSKHLSYIVHINLVYGLCIIDTECNKLICQCLTFIALIKCIQFSPSSGLGVTASTAQSPLGEFLNWVSISCPVSNFSPQTAIEVCHIICSCCLYNSNMFHNGIIFVIYPCRCVVLVTYLFTTTWSAWQEMHASSFPSTFSIILYHPETCHPLVQRSRSFMNALRNERLT